MIVGEIGDTISIHQFISPTNSSLEHQYSFEVPIFCSIGGQFAIESFHQFLCTVTTSNLVLILNYKMGVD